MAMTETPDPQLQLKKRARRRLVGAVAFAGLAAVVLPMVMDEEPKQQVQDVQIRIPGQDQVPFQPRLAARTAAPATGSTAVGEGPDKLAAPVPTDKPVATVAPPNDQASDRKADKPAEKPPERPPVKKIDKPAEKPPEKPADKKLAKPTEKTPEKPPARPAEKVPEKPPEKKLDKPAEKAPEKAPVKKVDKPAESGSEESSKPAADDASPASAAPAKPSAAAAKSGGQQVILIGAFANPDNAKQLQGKISAAGVSTYTEILETPDGKKTRVRAGPFPNREAADRAMEKLKAIGVSGVVAGRQ